MTKEKLLHFLDSATEVSQRILWLIVIWTFAVFAVWGLYKFIFN